MTLGLRGRMGVASMVVAVIVAAAFSALLLAMVELRTADERARGSVDLIAAAHRLERILVDAQAGTRGFVITGDERFLEPWHASRSEFPFAAAALRRHTGDDPRQAARVARIERAGRSYISDFATPLVETARRDLDRARTVVTTGEGKRRVDALRVQFDGLIEAENAVLAERRASSAAAAQRALGLGFGALGGCVLLILLFSGYLTRAIVLPVRRVSTASSRLVEDDSVRVPAGGAGEVAELGEAFNAMAESLKESRADLESERLELDRYFTLSIDMLGIAGLDGYFKRLNPVFEQTLGYTEEELLAQPFLSFVHPADREATIAEVESLSRGVDTIAFANRYRCKDGSYRWLQWSATAFPEQQRIYAAARDVTEQREAQQRAQELNDALQEQNAELARALEELAAERDRIEVFHRFADRLASELELEPFAGLALDEICDFADATRGTMYALDVQQGGVFALAATRGGDPRGMQPELTPGEGSGGRALAERSTLSTADGASEVALHLPLLYGDSVLGLLTLARERPFSAGELEAIEHLADQAAVLLSNRLALEQATRLAALNRAVLDATLDGIRLVDLEGRTLLANAEIVRLTTQVFGLHADSTLQERSTAIASRLVDPEAYLASAEAIARDPEAETVDEFQLADTGQSFRRYTAPVRDEAGKLIGRIIVVRETTAERETERVKSELMATVSHELRTPLTGIMGFAELLAKHEVDEGVRRSYAETIHTEAQRLTSLINDFLDLQRIEEGGFTLALEPFDLGELLRQTVDLYVAQSPVHALDLVLPEKPTVVQGERDRIAQVTANLLSNAVKYSPEGGSIRVAARASDGFLRVSVSDEGLGIPRAQQSQIFSRFFRVDSTDTRRIGGTGLGLALARDIVEAHGGSMGFASVEGEGSTFWFELPFGRVASNGRPKRVLVVEDDESAAALLAAFLEVEGFAVEVVATSEEALARAVAEPPDVVCLDLGLAGAHDGWHVLERLKGAARTEAIPVLVCTARNGRERAAALGAADFLTKPVSLEALRRAIDRMLNGAKHASILVVDDDPGVRRLVRESLSALGYETREAADGAEALDQVERNRPDAMVLDLVMPGVDGLAVLERLQARPETRLLPVVVLTGKPLTAAERRCLGRRAISVLEKSSFSQRELRRLVQQATS